MKRNDPKHPDIEAWYCYTYGLLGERQKAEKEYQNRNKSMTEAYKRWHDNIIHLFVLAQETYYPNLI